MKILTTLFFCIISISVFAQQPFAPIGAKWNFPQFFPFSSQTGLATYTSIGDTIIENKSCRIVYKDEYSCYANNGNHYFHQSNDSIFYYHQTDEEFHLLFVFNAQIGDSWEIQDLNFDAVYTCKVDSISYFYYSPNDSLKIQHIDFGNGTTIKLYENIGFDFAFFLPTGFPICDNAVEQNLLCYEDNILGQIKFSSEACVITSVKKLTPANSIFQTYPNPTSDELNISLSKTPLSNYEQFQLINLLGTVVEDFKIPTTEMTYSISIKHLPSGIYFLKYLKNGNLIRTEQVVIQK